MMSKMIRKNRNINIKSTETCKVYVFYSENDLALFNSGIKIKHYLELKI